MDTKSKNIRYTKWLKATAFLLCVAGMLAMAYGLLQVRYFPEAMQGVEYGDSQAYAQRVSSVYNNVYQLAFEYKSRENIASGGYLEKDGGYQNTLESMRQETKYAISEWEEEYRIKLDQARNNEDYEKHTALTNELLLQIRAEENKLAEQTIKARETAIEQELADYQYTLDHLNELDDMVYLAVGADGTIFTNATGHAVEQVDVAALPGSVVLREKERSALLSRYNRYYYQPVPAGGSVIIAQDGFAQASAGFRANRQNGYAAMKLFGAGALSLLLGMGWLLYAAGRRPGVEGVHLLAIDRIYLDIGLAAALVVGAFCTGGLYWLYSMMFESYSLNHAAVYALGILLLVCVTATGALFLTSAARRVKRREFLKRTLLYTVLSWLIRTVRGALDGGPAALKAALLFCGHALVSCLLFLGFAQSAQHGYSGGFAAFFLFLLFLSANAAALVYLLKKISALKAIQDGAGKIRSGNLSHRIEPKGGTPFVELAQSINGIADGLNAAVNDQVKAERMKAELVTNVSHDLKTPLTSIITYIDLLKAEGPGGENAAGYICVLDAKAQRLKALTDDLFEAAKAASGSIQPNLERLDVGELLTQGLGELSDRIGESGLDFRCGLPKERLFITADGKLLWRVMENLISNVFKYALPNSRVYIDAASRGGRVCIQVKNISAFELNLPVEELMERFTRGDRSRHSEGSGLGLSIARSLTELQGGSFRVEIDGDLFKAAVEFNEDTGE